jgi:hypothetical protein
VGGSGHAVAAYGAGMLPWGNAMDVAKVRLMLLIPSMQLHWLVITCPHDLFVFLYFTSGHARSYHEQDRDTESMHSDHDHGEFRFYVSILVLCPVLACLLLSARSKVCG